MQHILVADNTEFQIVVPTTLDDGRVTHIQLAGVHSSHILLVCYGRLHPLCKFCMFNFLQKDTATSLYLKVTHFPFEEVNLTNQEIILQYF
jgi:hypothetical protein